MRLPDPIALYRPRNNILRLIKQVRAEAEKAARQT